MSEQPRPRAAVHYGYAHYRDGDYFGREVNLAARVQARSGAGEVLVTRPVVEASGAALQLRAARRRAPARLQRADRAVPRARRGTQMVAVSTVRRRSSIAVARRGAARGRGRPVVVMLSGGRDSTCLLDVAVAVAGAEAVSALHVNYGLREGAAEDERHCRALCAAARRRARSPRTRRRRRPRQHTGLGARRCATAPPRSSRSRARRDIAADTPPPIRSRRSSTGWPPRRAAERCSGCARVTARWSGRCSVSRARRPVPTAWSAGSAGATTSPTTPAPTPAAACATGSCRRCVRSTRAPRERARAGRDPA